MCCKKCLFTFNTFLPQVLPITVADIIQHDTNGSSSIDLTGVYILTPAEDPQIPARDFDPSRSSRGGRITRQTHKKPLI